MISPLDRTARLRMLTPRQLEMLRLARGGRTTGEIAGALGLAPDSVLLERGIAYDKLGVASLPQDQRLQELAAYYDADRQAPIDPRPSGAEPSARASEAALAAVERDDRLLARGTVAAPLPPIAERGTERLDPLARPAGIREPYVDSPVLHDPVPRPWWGLGGGPVAIVVLFVAAVVVLALLAFLLTRSNQPAAAPQAATQATPFAETPPPQAQVAQPQAPVTPVPQTPAPQTPAPQAVAPQAPPIIIVQPPAAVAPAPAVPAAPAPAAPAAPVAAAPTAPVPAPAAVPSVVASSAASDTPAGTVLTPGQTWRQNGLELTLTLADVSGGGVTANFVLANKRPARTEFQFTRGSAFSAADSRNNRLQISTANFAYKFALDPNASAIMDASHDGGAVAFSGRLSDREVTSVTVKVNGIDSLSNAQWRIPVQH